MGLEELKNVWKSIDERLEKQEVLKENIIRKMIYDRSNRSLSKLVNCEILNMVAYLVVIPMIVFLANFRPFREQMQGKQMLGVWEIFLWVALAICVAGIAWSLIKIVALAKVDFTKNLKDISLLVAKYNIRIQHEKIVSIVLTPAIALGVAWVYTMMQASTFQWVSLTCAFIVGIFLAYYIYKRVYDGNIAAIRQSLDELKDMEELDGEA